MHYDSHQRLIEAISSYEHQKDQRMYEDDIVQLTHILRRPDFESLDKHSTPTPDEEDAQGKFRRGCWSGFISSYHFFAKGAVEARAARSSYVVYPNPTQEIMTPALKFLYGKAPPEGFLIEYDFRSQVLVVDFYDVLMLDYDYELGLTAERVVSFLGRVVEEAAKFNIGLAFALFPSDRGLHAFVVSHQYQRGLKWVDFMMAMHNDPMYTAFSYARGFGIRLTKKIDHPEDKVAWMEPLVLDAESVVLDARFFGRPFYSQYLKRSFELKFFGSQIRLLGREEDVVPELLSRVQLQYLLVQYGRQMTPEEVKQIECDIYASNIYPFSNRLERLTNDLQALMKLNQESAPVLPGLLESESEEEAEEGDLEQEARY